MASTDTGSVRASLQVLAVLERPGIYFPPEANPTDGRAIPRIKKGRFYVSGFAWQIYPWDCSAIRGDDLKLPAASDETYVGDAASVGTDASCVAHVSRMSQPWPRAVSSGCGRRAPCAWDCKPSQNRESCRGREIRGRTVSLRFSRPPLRVEY